MSTSCTVAAKPRIIGLDSKNIRVWIAKYKGATKMENKRIIK
jgi:hypothetical protein